jgi:hypothetical protein
LIVDYEFQVARAILGGERAELVIKVGGGNGDFLGNTVVRSGITRHLVACLIAVIAVIENNPGLSIKNAESYEA